ncbi:MAG: MerR family transcriptional regulator, partial [Planctomycetota bacterium]
MSERFPNSTSSEAVGNDGSLSIGDLSKSTGITPDAIRSWERKYGRPKPIRRPSGHRRYSRNDLRWLRRVAEALGRGHRASLAVNATETELEALLAGGSGPLGAETRVLLDLIRCYRRTEIVSTLLAGWNERGPRAFLEESVAPLLAAVGRSWADGDLDLRHEHFLTEVLEDFLRARRIEQHIRPGSPLLVLTTLPGERHSIGLQMAALVCAVEGVRSRNLGTETPVSEIARAARDAAVAGVAISVSAASGGVETDRRIAELRRALPEQVSLLAGGQGARGPRRKVRGVLYLHSLATLGERLRSR